MKWITFPIMGIAAVVLLVFALSAARVDAPAHMPSTATDEAQINNSIATTSTVAAPHAPKKAEEQKIAPAPIPAAPALPVKTKAKVIAKQEEQRARGEQQATRIQKPYPFSPFSSDTLNTVARAALVNIICTVHGGTGQSVTGSGMFIDPRGIIITNAHVGQYVLLSEVSTGIECVGRAGAPAQPFWKLRMIYMPEAWVNEHAKDLRSLQPTGTGEHDYAILLAEPITAAAPHSPFPHVPIDVREAIAFEGDDVLLASYPAGFVGNFIVQNSLYPATTFAKIRQLLTFRESSIDLLSLGGVILAQGGSSGGGVVNIWGRMVGIIVTTSEGETTAERDLRAITLAHVDRSLREHEGVGLADFLSNVEARGNDFRVHKLGNLAQKLTSEIPHQQ